MVSFQCIFSKQSTVTITKLTRIWTAAVPTASRCGLIYSPVTESLQFRSLSSTISPGSFRAAPSDFLLYERSVLALKVTHYFFLYFHALRYFLLRKR